MQTYAHFLDDFPRAADLWRPELRRTAAPPGAGRPGRRRHPGTGHGSHAAWHAQARRAAGTGARRGRRDAAHGLHRRRELDPRAHTRAASDRAVLRDHAEGDPQGRRTAPTGTPGRPNPVGDHDRGDRPPALLDRQRPAQARRPDPRTRDRALRRGADLRADQDRDRRNWPRNSPRVALLPRPSTGISRRRCASGSWAGCATVNWRC
jgi:hypothetical protein